jgi:hypothetical protein
MHKLNNADFVHTYADILQTLNRPYADYFTRVHVAHISVVINDNVPYSALIFAGPTWHQRDGSVLVASRRFDWSRSRKTKGSLADTLQCNIWRRAQTPHRMTHSLHGGDNGTGQFNGFTALGKSIGTPNATDEDLAYVAEHPVLKYFRAKLANFLNDFRRADWFGRLGLPVSNGRHNQLSKSQVRRLMRRVEQRVGFQGGGRGSERPEVQVFSRLDIGHKDFLGQQFVNCRPFGTHHEEVCMC